MTKQFSATIDGVAFRTAGSLDVSNPATEELVAQACNCGEPELNQAVNAARAAFPSWAATPLVDRQSLVAALGALIQSNEPELRLLLTAEQGKPHADATMDVLGGAFWCHVYSGMDLPVRVIEDTDEHRVEIRHTPLGVVGAIAPWNFPIFLAMMKVAPALVAGNCVILKPSPFTPLTTLRIGELSRGLFPPGVLNVVAGDDALGPMMTKHRGIDKISFTGSTETGRKVMENASPTLKRLTLELGGNDAAIILPDVDIEAVADKIFNAAFGNTGQVCIAVKRLYVHADIYDRFVKALISLIDQAKVGDGAEQGTQFGPIQNKQQYERIRDLIQDSKNHGYEILAGGGEHSGPGYFVPLTLIGDPPENSRIVQEEQFGPVLPVMRWQQLSDVVAKANATPFGLGGQVWSSDLDQATAIGGMLEVGNVYINQAQTILPNAPFGGQKSSGVGSESAMEGLLAHTNTQSVIISKASV